MGFFKTDRFPHNSIELPFNHDLNGWIFTDQAFGLQEAKEQRFGVIDAT